MPLKPGYYKPNSPKGKMMGRKFGEVFPKKGSKPAKKAPK